MTAGAAERPGPPAPPLVVGGWEPGAVALPWLVGEPWWAVWGISDAGSARRLVGSVWRSGAPPLGTGEPWALVLRRADGTLLATASTGTRSGLFWSVDASGPAPRLVVGPHPGEVVRLRLAPTYLDEEYLTAFAQLRMPSDGTPYRDVRRLRPGLTLAWPSPDAAARAVEWNGPSTWAPPTLEGPHVAGQFLEAFDRATSELSEDGVPAHVAMSAGLDSTFVAASLACQSDPDRPVTAYCYAPHPDAGLTPVGAFDPDEYELARLMEGRYPGRLRVVPLVNDSRRQQLDVAAAVSERTWLPVLNPANQVWMERIAAAASAAGSSRWFIGDLGNGVFSNDHSYAVAWHLRRGDGASLWRLVQDDPGGLPSSAVHQVVRPLLSPLRHRLHDRGQGQARRTRTAAGVPVAPPVPGRSARQDLALWLSQDLPFLGALPPGGGTAFPVDPFGDRGVTSLAAAIAPAQWRRGPAWRPFARTLMADRVPEEIRLRTRRGGQAWDAWFVAHDQRDRYEAEVALVGDTPVIGRLVDVGTLRATVRSWRWGELVGGAPLTELFEVDRLLVLAAFIRTADGRLRAAAGEQAPGSRAVVRTTSPAP